MALDPTIISRAYDVEQPDAARTLGTIGLLKGQQQEQAYRAQQMQRQQQQDAIAARKDAASQTIGGLLATGDTAGATQAAAATGDFDLMQHLSQYTAQQQKAITDHLDQKYKAAAPLALQLQGMPYETRKAVIAHEAPRLIAHGWTQEELAQFDPTDQNLGATIAGAQTVEEAQKAMDADRKFKLDKDKFGHTVANDAAQIATQRRGQDITLRGQNLVDARAKEATAALGKPPQGYQWKADGSLEAIKGGPGDTSAGGGKPLTETQAKATGYYGRATMANRTLNEFEAKGAPPPGAGAKLADEIPLGLASGLIGDANQQQLAARRAFVAAVLRQESGAAISNSEFKSYDKLYFPQQGDTKETKNYKRQLRDQAAKSLAIAAGPGAGQMEMAIPATGGGVPADIAAILAKHK